MRKNNLIVTLVMTAAALLMAAGAYALYMQGVKNGQALSADAETTATAKPIDMSSIAAGEAATRRHIKDNIKAGDVDPANGQRIIYYHDPMVPGKRFDAPAKSPFMDMMLVPVYNAATGSRNADDSSVTIDARAQQNLGIRTAEVTQGSLTPLLSATGSIAWNERDQSVIQARAAGFIERLYVRATLDAVHAGQPFADVYVPEWVAAQQEFLSLKKLAGQDTALIAAARQRMLLSGMNEAQISRVEVSGVVQARTTLTVPSTGVVAELLAREGMTVAPGALLARINGLATVWAVAEVPESQIAWVRPGAKVRAQSPGAPGVVFDGTVQAILPEVATATRTLKARVQLANPGAALSPGMQVTMQFAGARNAPALLIPTEAVIATGQRTVVMLAESGGRYRPVNVEMGMESDGQTEITKGLEAGQRVVVSSQFLIDSEASLKGVESRLNTELPASPVMHQGEGRVDAMDKDAITLTHGPIASLGWGSMTMAFKRQPYGSPRTLAVGDQVHFEFVVPKDGEPTLTGINPLVPRSATSAARRGASK